MNVRNRSGLIVLAAFILSGCNPATDAPSEYTASPPSAPANEAEAITRGKAIAGEAFAVLSGNLLRALGESGPAQALHFCSVHAGPLSGGVAATNHVHLKRITQRARNPQNRATSNEEKILDQFREQLASAAASAVPVVTRSDEGRFVFYAPIVLNNSLCLQCHGDLASEIAPDLLELLKKLYPEDRATGYRLGDLRGAWRIEFLSPAP